MFYECPGGAVVKNLHAHEGDTRDGGSIPGYGRSPGVGNGNPLENLMDRGACRATIGSQRVRHD